MWAVQIPNVGAKPAVIVSHMTVSLALRPIVARITSVERVRSVPTTVTLVAGEVDRLPNLSYVLCHDLLTVDESGMSEHLGAVPRERLIEIEDRLAFVFGLGDVN
ncbi:MAG: type II toxin-antitoxin system PemK/MazF family toxin [Solirubrobacteraceae bacterium]